MSNTPKTPKTPAIPDLLVLAAVERAVRHRARAGTPTPMWEILRHLDIPARSGAARRVRARINELATGDLLTRQRSHGTDAWQLTLNGRRRIQRARRMGRDPQLPESPQHQAWRNARALSAQEIERSRDELRQAAQCVLRLLDAEGVPSDAWFALSDDLRRCAWIVGSMTHCLHEWQEPEDARGDWDDHAAPGDKKLPPGDRGRAGVRRSGRRNPRLWHP